MPSPDSPEPLPDPAVRAVFADTRWSMVLQAGSDSDGTEKSRALEALCRTYWPPLYAWLRASGHAREDAEDLVQSLFHEILTGDMLTGVDRDRGRFRSFLMTALKNMVVDEFRKRTAAKRGGGAVTVTFNASEGEHLVATADNSRSPDAEFDRNWARTVIAAATADLRENYAAAGRESLFEALRPCLFGAGQLPGYDRLSEELGLSKGAVAMSVKRMRERFTELIARRVADTVANPADVRDEMRYLLSLFACG